MCCKSSGEEYSARVLSMIHSGAAMQKTLAGSQPMVQWYQCKPIMGVM